MGPPGIPSFGGMFPSTGLGAAAALWKQRKQKIYIMIHVYLDSPGLRSM